MSSVKACPKNEIKSEDQTLSLMGPSIGHHLFNKCVVVLNQTETILLKTDNTSSAMLLFDCYQYKVLQNVHFSNILISHTDKKCKQ